MANIIFCTIYALLFSFIILRSPAFRLPGFKNLHSLLVFYLKLVFGVLLWYIYAHHYKSRITSDIFKYYDDSNVIYSAMHNSFMDFLKLVTGIGDNTAAMQRYYTQMNNWANNYQSDLYNNSHLIIRLNAVFRLLSGGHYGVHVIFMCFISLLGLIYLYKAFYPYLTERYKGLFVAVFLFPSVLLWGSGILKEGIIFLGLGLLIYFFEKLVKKEGALIQNIFFVILGSLLVFDSKAYVLLCMLPCFIAELLINKVTFAGKHPRITYLIITCLYLGAGIGIGKIIPRYDPLNMLAAKQVDFNRISSGGLYLVSKTDSNRYAYLPASDTALIVPADTYADSLLHNYGIQFLASSSFTGMEKASGRSAWFLIQKGLYYKIIDLGKKDTLYPVSNGDSLFRVDIYNEPARSMIDITPMQPTITGLFSSIPKALAIAVLRPLPSEVHSSMVLIYFVENVITLLLVMVAFVFFKRSGINYSKAAFCFIYCLLMLTLIGLETPVYGGIERYKCVVMPFLLILLLLIYDKDKIKRMLKR